MAEDDQIRQILTWIGFTIKAEKNTIVDDAMASYDDLLCLNTKDVTALSADFSQRSVANGKIVFGSCRTKKLQSVLYWVKDFRKISETPTIGTLMENVFSVELTKARHREEV